jgi:hypothetical protein
MVQERDLYCGLKAAAKHVRIVTILKLGNSRERK